MKPAGKCVSEKDIDAEITRRAKAIRAEIEREALLQQQEEREKVREIILKVSPNYPLLDRKSSIFELAAQKISGAIVRSKAKYFPTAQDEFSRMRLEQGIIGDFCQACQDLLHEYDLERLRLESRLLLANREIHYLKRPQKAGLVRNCAGAVLLKRKRAELAVLHKDYEEWTADNAERLAVLQRRLFSFDHQLACALRAISRQQLQRSVHLMEDGGMAAFNLAFSDFGVIGKVEKRVAEIEKLAGVKLPEIQLNSNIFKMLENQVNEREKRSKEIIEELSTFPAVEVESFTVDELKNMYSQLQMAHDAIQSQRFKQIGFRHEAFESFLKAQKYVIVWDERLAAAQQQGDDDLSKQAKHRLDGAKIFVEEFRDRLRQMRKAFKPTIELQKKIGKSLDVIRRRLVVLGVELPGEPPEENI